MKLYEISYRYRGTPTTLSKLARPHFESYVRSIEDTPGAVLTAQYVLHEDGTREPIPICTDPFDME